jgi:methylated-DNA-[protein]-cysteine S-methyltransferase
MKLDVTAQARLQTPLGEMTAAASERGLAGLWFDGQRHHPGPLDAPVDPRQRWLQAAQGALDAYFDGQPFDAAALHFDLQGTPFQQSVWRQLLRMGRGETCSYAALARRAGAAHAVRAVGAAVGRNPVSILVPCHRVLASSGALTGYAGGLHRKHVLLVHENVLDATSRPPA